jgi:hypothetical protein
MFLSTLTRAVLFVLLTAAVLPAAHEAAGIWDCAAISPDGEPVKFALRLQEENGQLSGVVETGQGENRLGPLKYENSTVTFKVDYRGDMYTLELKISGDKLTGTYKGDPATGEVKGARRK